MRDNLRIHSLSSKLEQIGDCLQIGYYASLDYKDTKDYLTDLHREVERLCQKYYDTMLTMQNKAGNALDELVCGFRDMLYGSEDLGLERIGNVGGIAGQIKSAVDEMQKEGLCPDVVKSMRGTEPQTQVQVEEAMQRTRYQKARRDRENAESRVESLRRLEKGAESAERRYRRQHDHFHSHGGGDCRVSHCVCRYVADIERNIAEQARRERREEEERVRELKRKEMVANIELHAIHAKKLSETMNDLQKMAQEAINGAEAGMKPLNSILESMSNFWEKNQTEFESIGNTAAFDNLRKMFADENVSDARRKQFWTGKAFKQEALEYIARLAAVQSMCMDFRKKMVPVLENMSRVNADTPSPEEARAKLPGLIEQYKNRVKQDAIEQSKHEEKLAIVGSRYAQDEDEPEDKGEDERKDEEDEDFAEAILKDVAADA